MNTLYVLGQILALGALLYGGWLCFVHAGRYDADERRADEAASRGARVRSHAEDAPGPAYPPLDVAA